MNVVGNDRDADTTQNSSPVGVHEHGIRDALLVDEGLHLVHAHVAVLRMLGRLGVRHAQHHHLALRFRRDRGTAPRYRVSRAGTARTRWRRSSGTPSCRGSRTASAPRRLVDQLRSALGAILRSLEVAPARPPPARSALLRTPRREPAPSPASVASACRCRRSPHRPRPGRPAAPARPERAAERTKGSWSRRSSTRSTVITPMTMSSAPPTFTVYFTTLPCVRKNRSTSPVNRPTARNGSTKPDRVHAHQRDSPSPPTRSTTP